MIRPCIKEAPLQQCGKENRRAGKRVRGQFRQYRKQVQQTGTHAAALRIDSRSGLAGESQDRGG